MRSDAHGYRESTKFEGCSAPWQEEMKLRWSHIFLRIPDLQKLLSEKFDKLGLRTAFLLNSNMAQQDYLLKF